MDRQPHGLEERSMTPSTDYPSAAALRARAKEVE